MNYPGAVDTFHLFGAVEVINATDPKQILTVDGRWTFDATSLVYQKSFWLLWPSLVHGRESKNLGNVIESILGVRESAI